LNTLNWIALSTITRREIQRFLRIWTQTLLPSPISIILYFAIFGGLIGPRIGAIDGYNYVQYIAPGLIMMAVINNAFSNVVASFYGAKFQKSIEEMLVSPMSNWVILVGYTLGGIARGCVVGLIVTLVALFFTKLHMTHVGLTLSIVLLTATLFSLAGFINAMFSKKFDDINIIPTFILTPLTYFGGVFYSVTMLGPFWQKVSYFNPILYMVNAFRYGMMGVSDVPIQFSISALVGLNIGLFLTAWHLLAKGMGLKT
jgi:ABC-2 type transport system permease protein